MVGPLDENLKRKMEALRADYEAVVQLICASAADKKEAGDSGDDPGKKEAVSEPDLKRSRVHESAQESLALLEATFADDDAMETDDKAIVEAKQNGEIARQAILDAERNVAEGQQKLMLANEEANKSAQSYKQIKENHKRGDGPYGRGSAASGGGDSLQFLG